MDVSKQKPYPVNKLSTVKYLRSVHGNAVRSSVTSPTNSDLKGLQSAVNTQRSEWRNIIDEEYPHLHCLDEAEEFDEQLNNIITTIEKVENTVNKLPRQLRHSVDLKKQKPLPATNLKIVRKSLQPVHHIHSKVHLSIPDYSAQKSTLPYSPQVNSHKSLRKSFVSNSSNNQQVIMQVNKFIPHSQRKHEIHENDSKAWSRQTNTQHDDLQPKIRELNTGLNEIFQFQVDRAPTPHIQNRDYDSDQEKEDAYKDQMQKVNRVRETVIENFIDLQEDVDHCKQGFHQEREFFVKEAQKQLDVQLQMKSEIEEMESYLDKIRQDEVERLAEKELDLICEKALGRYRSLVCKFELD